MFMNKKFSLYKKDFFGDEIQPSKGLISERFIIPPFSILNAREGIWQSRKRRWIGLGIRGEIGRKDDLIPNDGGMKSKRRYEKKSTVYATQYEFPNGSMMYKQTGTSIFDPVLCELMYKWFCPIKGQIIDPFAGGSVRGIVAYLLDFKYWGCDLRQEQIDTNYEQAKEIIPDSMMVSVEISKKMLMQKFQPCKSDYIKSNCVGRCCEGTNQILVSVHETEEQKFKNMGASITNGFIQPNPETKKCPFKKQNGLCKIHDEKPFGCKASPFTFNSNNLLIVRNRYRSLKCYNTEKAIPIYESHRWSLEQIFGKKETTEIIKKVINGNDKIQAKINKFKYKIMIDNDSAKRKAEINELKPNVEWICGDALNELANTPEADFIFSCPPYGDLEKYSDDPRDLSNMNYDKFLDAYYEIIKKACAQLKQDRFACFVVADFRDKDGFYNDFVSETINAFLETGLKLYNEIILVTSIGSLPIRITKQFNASRKVGKTHQNILVFIKGDPKKATKKIEEKIK